MAPMNVDVKNTNETLARRARSISEENIRWPSGVYANKDQSPEIFPAQASAGLLPQSPADAPAPHLPESDRDTSTALWRNLQAVVPPP